MGASPTSVDPAKLLAQLEAIVKNNTTTTTPAPPAPAKTESKSWVGTLIIVAVVLMGVAVFAWISWVRNRELAKLRHEEEKRKILAEKAVADQKVAKNEAEVARAEKKRLELAEDLRRAKADVLAEEKRYEADVRAIDRIRSWRDVPGME